MAPIQRRRFIDTSDSEITSGIEEQEDLDLGLSSEVGVEEGNASGNEETQDESVTREKVVIRPKLIKRVEKNESEGQPVKVIKKKIKPKSGENTENSDENFDAVKNSEPKVNMDFDKIGEERQKLVINELSIMKMHDLREFATQYGLQRDELAPMKKQELIFAILKAHTSFGGIIST